MVKYTNRYGDVFTFDMNERGNIEWKGNFEFARYGYVNGEEDIIMVDPSGGPYINIGTDMRIFGFYTSKVVGFIKQPYGWELVINNNL